MMKKLVSIVLALVMALGLLSTTAWADDNLTYLDWDGTKGKLVAKTLGDTTTTVDNVTGNATWSAGWYVVEGSKTITGTVTVEGNVHLLLKNGCDLTINGGIKSNSGNLTIYAQPEDTTPTGKLTVNGSEGGDEDKVFSDGIYVDTSSALTINGGMITATGANLSAQGSGQSAYSYGIDASGTLTINGGSVMATGGSASGQSCYSYGIKADTLTFNCGTLIAKSGTANGDGSAQAIYGSPTLPTDYWWSTNEANSELTASSTAKFENSSNYTYVKLYKEPVIEEATPETPETPDNEPVSGGHTPIRRQNTVTNTVDTTRTDTVTSAKTFDTGVAVYAVMAAASLFGMGYVGKKR